MKLMLKTRDLINLTVLSLLTSMGSCQEEPKPRYMVRGQGAKEAAVALGGKVVMEIPKRGITALEFDDLTMVEALKDRASKSNFEIEEDQIRELIPGMPSKGSEGGGRRLAESIPWGIGRTYERDGVADIPDDSHFPDSAVHPICIIDSGYDVDHPDLPNDAEGTTNNWSNDQCDHGTHVSGTIAAIRGNGQGVIGVWPGAPDIKVARTFSTFFIFGCIFTYSSGLIGAAEDCADLGAKIITMSLGGPASTDMEREAFADLYDEGVLHIAAAGNGGNSACSYPACYDSVMSVGATDINNNIAYFSTYNNQNEISGPGVDVESTIPGNGYDFYDGTSMATPHVSGAALALWNNFPSATNVEIRAALNNGAIDLGSPGRDVFYGYGLLNYWNSYDILSGGSPPVECLDSTLNVASAGIGCADITDLSICTNEAAKTHCPNTCEVCGEYECVDSVLTFDYNGRSATCTLLASQNQATIDQACEIEGIYSTCRATCGCV